MVSRAAPTTADNLLDMQRTFRQRLAYVGRFIWRDRSGIIGILMFSVVVFAAVMAPFILAHDPLEQNMGDSKMPPAWSAGGAWTHPFGTDNLGRDMLSRVVYGARVSLTVGFFGVLIEHYAGEFPLWLAPLQCVLLPITDRHRPYAETVRRQLADAGIRVELDDRNEKIGYKIREWETKKVPYMLVVGDKEQEAGAVSVRRHRKGDQGSTRVSDLVASLTAEIERKTITS